MGNEDSQAHTTEASCGSHHEEAVAVAVGHAVGHYVLCSRCDAPFVAGVVAAVPGVGVPAMAIGGLTSTGSELRL